MPHYIFSYPPIRGSQMFINENPDTGSLQFTSCPHLATFYTAKNRAARLRDQLERDFKDTRPKTQFVVLTTRAADHNLIRGNA